MRRTAFSVFFLPHTPVYISTVICAFISSTLSSKQGSGVAREKDAQWTRYDWGKEKKGSEKEMEGGREREERRVRGWRYDTSCLCVWGGCCTGPFNRLSPRAPSTEPASASGSLLQAAVALNLHTDKKTTLYIILIVIVKLTSN